jgi:hypothetical protein
MYRQIREKRAREGGRGIPWIHSGVDLKGVAHHMANPSMQ